MALPTNSDLAQLSAATRFMRPQYVLDTGTVNHVKVTLNPSPSAWAVPLSFFVQILNGNTSATVDVEIVGIATKKNLVKRSGVALAIGDLVPGVAVLLTFDGTNVRCTSILPSEYSLPAGGGGVITVLPGNKDYFINPSSGNDSNDGLTTGTAWRTLQFAYSWVQRNIDLASYTVTFHCADGTYTTGVMATGLCRGQSGPGGIVWIGNTTTPANCNVAITSGTVCFGAGSGAKMTIRGFKCASTINGMTGISASGAGSEITIDGPMEYGPVGTIGAGALSGHIAAGGGASINITNSYTVSGGGAGHMVASQNGSIGCLNITVTLIGNPLFQVANYSAQANGTLTLNDIFNHIITFSGTAQGPRYLCLGNGVIFVYSGGGIAGANYLPGTIGGSVGAGGQYY